MSTVANPLAGFSGDTESIVNAANQQFGRRIHIVSLHFMERHAKREYRTRRDGGPWTIYHLAAVKKAGDRPSVTLALDGFDRVFKGTRDAFPYTKIHENEARTALEIAADIVNDFAGAPPSGPDDTAHPAIWISKCGSRQDVQLGQARGLIPAISIDPAGMVTYSKEWDSWGTPEFERQFPEFMAELNAFLGRQWRFCEAKLSEGDDFSSGPTANPRSINEIHRYAGSYIGANVAEHKWLQDTAFGAQAPCPFCGASTSTSHPNCQNCGRVVDQAMYDRVEAKIKKSSGGKQAG